jgi:hypothetical protein
MAFVPAVPGFSPVSYGQGFGDWKQYAGFNKQNPFGALPDLSQQPKAPVAPPAAPKIDASVPPVDYSIGAQPPATPFGAAPTNTFAVPKLNAMGQPEIQEEDPLRKSIQESFR